MERKKILIADDEEDVLDMIEIRLNYAGFEVMKAMDGEELVESAIREKPDLIVTDIRMPKMDGFKALKILRSTPETAAIPIMILTAKQNHESELKELGVTADDYIIKPFRHEDLLAKIRMHIGEKT